MLDRASIVARLREIAALLELHGGNRYKTRAFARGARSLEQTQEPIERLVEDRERLLALPGIGVALAKQIEELHRTGTSELLSSLREGLPRGVLELSQISGVGLHALRVLSKELGIESVADLRKAAEEGRLREVRGFGEKKEAKILESLAKYEAGSTTRLGLGEGHRLAASIAEELEVMAGVERVDVAGALRRFEETALEIDLVLTSPDPAGAIRLASERPRFSSIEVVAAASEAQTHSASPAPCRARLPDGTRVHLRACTPARRGATLIEATGPAAHTHLLEERARARGFDGLASLAPTDREEDVYAQLGLPFVPPELRDRSELADDLATELVQEKDVRGFVHCHSTWSDGKATIEEMALAAQALGADFITITDHSKTAHYANGLDVDRLLRQWEEIDEVQVRVQIRILKGTESDILADGALDWPLEILEQLDVVIASIHARYKQEEDAMTERLLRAVRAPVFKIWGHPLGRLITSRPPVPCRVEEVLDAIAEEGNCAIEINGSPHRLDLEPRWSREARARGIPFVLSVDAHSIRELDNVRYAVGMARRAGLRREDVLNTFDPATFRDRVHPTRSLVATTRKEHRVARRGHSPLRG